MHPAALALLLACAHRAPLSWAAPAVLMAPTACDRAPEAIAADLRTGLRLDGETADTLFPDLGLVASWVGHATLRADEAHLCGAHLVVRDPELRFWNRRGEPLDVALITDTMVHPRLIMALRRDEIASPPPEGAWMPLDATGLRRIGWTDVGIWEGARP